MIEGDAGQLLPFLKWAGGKRWLVAARPELFAFDEERFIEPFLGSGAVYFYVRPSRAVLSDVNRELISTYSAIKRNWPSVQSALEDHAKSHSAKHYYKTRSAVDLKSSVLKAARFIYLNRTCWNGLYRVNRQGQFNVPIGTKTNVLLSTDDFQDASKLLKGAALHCRDFEETVDESSGGDFLFVDPPYTVKHNLNGFIKYNEKLFSWEDQIRLKKSLVRADRRGVKILMTNADHASIRELYSGKFRLDSAERNSVLAGVNRGRGKVTELIIRNW